MYILISDEKSLKQFKYKEPFIAEVTEKYSDNSVLVLINIEQGKVLSFYKEDEYVVTDKKPPKHFMWECDKCKKITSVIYDDTDYCYHCHHKKFTKKYDED